MRRRPNPNIDAAIRVLLAAASVIAQILFFLWLTETMVQAGSYLYTAIQAFSFFTIVKLVNRHDSPSYKIAWILIVFLMPVFGLLLYFLWGRANHRRFRKLNTHNPSRALWDPDGTADARLSAFSEEAPARSRIPRFLQHHGFPIYREDTSEFFPLGENCFDALCSDLEQATSFIFLEFFIVGEGFLWDKVSGILRRKAREGVEVRFLMDDFGGLKLTRFERNRLAVAGVRLKSFNPILRHLSNLYLNYRNHQKIVSIDGRIAYTGGVNLADEYANLNRKHGHWKDTAVRVTGDGVWSLTLSFLQMWNLDTKTAPSVEDLRWRCPAGGACPAVAVKNPGTGGKRTAADGVPDSAGTAGDTLHASGWILPFTDGPSNNPVNPAKAVCQQMIESASRYVWITTPYLILEEDMIDSLCRAAESGVDVRIITPSVPDKWYVHLVTRSHYGRLIETGVRIYEYTPGFMHAKMIVSDDDHALVGTINFDFRSFYLQYENAVWFHGSPIVGAVRDDYLLTLEICREIPLAECLNRPWYTRMLAAGFRMFSTLM